MLRGAAERLQNSPSHLLCRAGARYLELDPHPVEVIEPTLYASTQGARSEGARVPLPAYAGETPDGGETADAGETPDADEAAHTGETADAGTDRGFEPGDCPAEDREAPPA